MKRFGLGLATGAIATFGASHLLARFIEDPFPWWLLSIPFGIFVMLFVIWLAGLDLTARDG